MRILVVGAGAVGGYFGGRLVEAGRDVTFLVRSVRAEILRRDGLKIKSPHGDVFIRPKLVSADALAGPYDVIILSVKGYTLTEAMHDLAPAVGPDTMILPVLNGMLHMDRLIDRFGKTTVIGGVCLIAGDQADDGTILQLTKLHSLTYGELSGGRSDRMDALDQVLSGSGFDAHLSKDIVQAMWEKWVQLASVGAINCLLGGTIGDVAGVPGGADLARRIVMECASVSAACGHAPSAGFLDRLGGTVSETGSRLTSSMYRDRTKGLRVEAQTIISDLYFRGRDLGVETPLVNAARVALGIYERRVEGSHAKDAPAVNAVKD